MMPHIALIDRKSLTSSVELSSSAQESPHSRSTSIPLAKLQNFNTRPDQQRPLYTELPSQDTFEAQPTQIDFSDDCEHDDLPIWTPPSLRRLSLLCLVIFNVLLLLVVALLHRTSAGRSRICKDEGSASVYFAWRFLPTIIAVIYVFAS